MSFLHGATLSIPSTTENTHAVHLNYIGYLPLESNKEKQKVLYINKREDKSSAHICNNRSINRDNAVKMAHPVAQ
ncbi:hypothetical protein M513_08326 [Trichuris suis]|uniref:Uncharacterized protein n=1 Tax=Trichuris suis TaxID=68888 RepID=A0A085M0N9_9BILA|nr:hypothetical protein M513_08326 [Trichuris suis]